MIPNFKPDREHTYHVTTPAGAVLHRCFSAYEAGEFARKNSALMWRTPILDLYPDVLINDFSTQPEEKCGPQGPRECGGENEADGSPSADTSLEQALPSPDRT